MVSTTAGAGAGAYATFLAAFLAGALCWSLGLSALVGWGRRFVGPSFFRAIDALCGVALGWFGLRLLWATLRRAAAWHV